jgi:hypothetical protein
MVRLLFSYFKREVRLGVLVITPQWPVYCNHFGRPSTFSTLFLSSSSLLLLLHRLPNLGFGLPGSSFHRLLEF